MIWSRQGWRGLPTSLLAGSLAGCAALAVDRSFEWLTGSGVWFALPLRFFAAYLGAGLIAAGMVEIAVRLTGRWSPQFTDRFATAWAILSAPAIFERVAMTVAGHLGPGAGLTLGMVALIAFGVWISMLARVAESWAAAHLIAAIGGSWGLALNRNVLVQPLVLEAVVVDAVVIVLSVVSAVFVRRIGVVQGLACSATLVLLVTFVEPDQRRRPVFDQETRVGGPNLLLVVIDTLRQDVFESVLTETVEGERLRRGLAGAVWFDHAVAAAPWTNPSVGSIMTGRYPSEHGFGLSTLGDGLASSVPTLAEGLDRQGYWTEALIANPLLYSASGIYRGFDRHQILSGPTRTLPLLTALQRVDLVRGDPYQDAAAVRRQLSTRLAEISSRSGPFFLWLQLMDPHHPFGDHDDLSVDGGVESQLHPQERRYRDEVRFVARELADMLDLFREYGVWRETVMVLVADHGEMFPSDGHLMGRPSGVDSGQPVDLDGSYGAHGHALHQELIRVPLLIRPAGGSPRKSRVSALVSHVDLHDSILDLLGSDLPRIGGERVSVAPWVMSSTPESRGARRAVIASRTGHPPLLRSLETSSFKLIDHPGREIELFELSTDPGELVNLAESRPQQVSEMMELLEYSWSGMEHLEPREVLPDDREVDRELLEAVGYVN